MSIARRHRETPAPLSRPPSRAEQVSELDLDSCGRKHPNRPARVCTLPYGHGPVSVPGMPFPMSHFDAKNQVAWRENP